MVICGSTFFDILWGTIYVNIMNLGTTIGAKIHWLQAIAFRLPPQALVSVRCGQKSRQVWWAWVCGFQLVSPILEIHRSTPLGNEIKIIKVIRSHMAMDQYLYIPIFSGMNIHLPAILMWTKGVQGFDPLPYWKVTTKSDGFFRARPRWKISLLAGRGWVL